jgi:hypothetical protein
MDIHVPLGILNVRDRRTKPRYAQPGLRRDLVAALSQYAGYGILHISRDFRALLGRDLFALRADLYWIDHEGRVIAKLRRDVSHPPFLDFLQLRVVTKETCVRRRR